MLALQRNSGKQAAGHVPLDIFDEASLAMESSNQGRTWFVREARLLRRAGGIGQSYEALRAASHFSAMIARNPVEAEGRPKVANLLRTVFAALGAGASPQAVLFKGVYRFALEEGYPVKQQWLPFPSRPSPASSEGLRNTFGRTQRYFWTEFPPFYGFPFGWRAGTVGIGGYASNHRSSRD